MAQPTRIRATLKDGVTDARVLMSHPMEGGLRKDAAGKLIPAHYITDVKASVGDRVVLACTWGTAVSQNPFLQFRFKGAQVGDKLTVTWTDNTGESRTDDSSIA